MSQLIVNHFSASFLQPVPPSRDNSWKFPILENFQSKTKMSRRGFLVLKAHFKMTVSFLISADSMKSYWNLKMDHFPYVTI